MDSFAVKADAKRWERRDQPAAVRALLNDLEARYPRVFGPSRKVLAAGQVRRMLKETGCGDPENTALTDATSQLPSVQPETKRDTSLRLT
jgi:hypothetical protein